MYVLHFPSDVPVCHISVYIDMLVWVILLIYGDTYTYRYFRILIKRAINIICTSTWFDN